MAEPGGLPSMGSHRVGHDWSDLADFFTMNWLEFRTRTHQWDAPSWTLERLQTVRDQLPQGLEDWKRPKPWGLLECRAVGAQPSLFSEWCCSLCSGTQGTGRSLSSDSDVESPVPFFSLQPYALSFWNKGKQVQKLPGRGFLFWLKRKDLLKPILGSSPTHLTANRAVLRGQFHLQARNFQSDLSAFCSEWRSSQQAPDTWGKTPKWKKESKANPNRSDRKELEENRKQHRTKDKILHP